MLPTMTLSAANLNLTFKGKIEAVKIYLVLLLIGGIAFVVSLFTDISLCIIWNVTGIPCFSCGMTRAFGSLPDVRRAFFYHPLFFTVPFLPLLVLVSARVRNIMSAVLIILFIGLWITRMILLFPHTAPMEYNESSLFELILRRI